VIRVFDEAGNVIETHEHAGDFKEPPVLPRITSAFPVKGVSDDSAFFGFLPSNQPN
jgi:hypothetical protein